MAFPLIHTVGEADARQQAGHRARCPEGRPRRRMCSWRGRASSIPTAGQVAARTGASAGAGRGGGREVACGRHPPCTIYRSQRHARDERGWLPALPTAAVFYATKRTWRVGRGSNGFRRFSFCCLKNKVYSCVFKSQCPLLSIAAQKAGDVKPLATSLAPGTEGEGTSGRGVSCHGRHRKATHSVISDNKSHLVECVQDRLLL